jgi:hypothetical protein
MVRRAGVEWTRRLGSAVVTDRDSWLREITSVEEECVLVRRKLASLPVSLASDIVALYAVQEFTKLITAYHNHSRDSEIIDIYDRQINDDVCGNMLKAVLLPCISTFDIGMTKSYFVQNLLIKLLYVIPNIKSLILPPSFRTSLMFLFLQRTHILTNLQEFQFYKACTTQIIIELAKYCPGMKKISVQNSVRVNDHCVQHLLNFRNLLFLNVAQTSISINSYTALLSDLPQIQTVVWFRAIDPVLSNLTINLPSVTEFVGRISDARLLVQKCPNIKKLVLRCLTEDISGLGELRSVAALTIFGSNCTLISLTRAIIRLGANLTTLKLHNIKDIYMSDFINYCPVLNSLTISYCNVTHTEAFDPALPHFRNLKKLQLIHNVGLFDFCSVLHLYVNLNIFRAVDMAQITDAAIHGIIHRGGFRHVTEIVVANCGNLNMNTALFLMENCPNLTRLGNIGKWFGVTNAHVATLLNYIKHNNLSVLLCR